jgi:hypothetical protein
LGKSPDGLDGWESDIFKPAPFRNFPNAESALLVRQNGILDFQDEVISGPFFPSGIYNSDSRINTAFPKAVAWRVGEKIDISSYLIFKVPKIEIKLDSLTPDICTTKDAILSLMRLGECQFSIEALRNSDYASYKIKRKIEVNLSRSLPYFYVPKIPNQTIATLPFQIETELVTSENRLVTPQAQTPTICLNNGTLISIYSSGTCQLKYFLEPTESTFASDVIIQSFEVYKKSQTMTFSTPTSGSIESGSVKLEANASSGGSILFTTTLTDVCSVSGSTLNFLKPGVCTVTATQPGTSTIAAISTSATVTITGTLPVVKKTISCVKGTKTIKKTAISPKCPAGYKLKK